MKKLVGPITIVSLALFGCGQGGEEPADTTQTEESGAQSSSVQSPNEIIAGIQENGASEDDRPSVSLDFSSGVQWEGSSYVAVPESGTITIAGYIEGGDALFLVKDGEVLEEIELNEAGEFEYSAEAPSEETVYHFVADNRLEVGQTDVNVDETDRAEEIVFRAE